jgi:hypothetical protein
MSAAIKETRGAPDLAVRNRRLTELVAACSIEISPRDDLAGGRLRELLDPGTTVFVNHPGSVTHHDIVAACARLRDAGFEPVPHIAVRRLASFTQASDFLQRAVGQAQVRAALIIGGDPDHPVGPFPDSHDFWSSATVCARSPSPAIRRVIRGSPRAPSTKRCGPKWLWRAGRASMCRW